MAHRPKSQLVALERNILKYRALEMILTLAYAEDLKEFVCVSLNSTNKIMNGLAKTKGEVANSPDKQKPSEIWDYCASVGIITPEEKEEIKKLISFRNDIGHRVYQLVMDIGPLSWQSPNQFKYNYHARERLKYYQKELRSRVSDRKYIYAMTGVQLTFAVAEKAYEEELKRLEVKIKSQHSMHKEEVDRLNKILPIMADKLEEAFPHYYLNKNGADRLTKQGIEVCYWLFEQKTDLLIIAHLLRLSYSAVVNRHKKWLSLKSIKAPIPKTS